MCFDDDSHPPVLLSENSSARGEDTRLTARDGTSVAAYRAEPGETPRAQVVVLPDARGLHNFYKELALRFADQGIRALTFDYFARSAENDDRTEPFDYRTHIGQMTPETFKQDLDAALADVRSEGHESLSTFVLGFCMGGSLSFWAGSQEYDLSGVVGFYGGLARDFGPVRPASTYARKVHCPLLGLFGGADQGISQEDIDRFEEELNAAHVPHEIVVYPGAPHSFFDRKADEFALASADAWMRVQAFIADHEAVRV